MKINKTFFLGIPLILVLIVGTIWIGHNLKAETPLSDGINEPSSVAISGDYPGYPDLDSLVKGSDIVISGKVINVYPPQELNVSAAKDWKEHPVYEVYTVSDISVDKVLKGNVLPGDIVKVKQRGGSYGGTDYIESNVEFLKKDTKHIFFLESYNFTPCSLLNPLEGDISIVDSKVKAKDKNLVPFDLFKDGTSEDELVSLLKEKVEKLKVKK